MKLHLILLFNSTQKHTHTQKKKKNLKINTIRHSTLHVLPKFRYIGRIFQNPFFSSLFLFFFVPLFMLNFTWEIFDEIIHKVNYLEMNKPSTKNKVSIDQSLFLFSCPYSHLLLFTLWIYSCYVLNSDLIILLAVPEIVWLPPLSYKNFI